MCISLHYKGLFQQIIQLVCLFDMIDLNGHFWYVFKNKYFPSHLKALHQHALLRTSIKLSKDNEQK